MAYAVPATRWHAFELAPRLRHADREEVKAVTGSGPLPALLSLVDDGAQAGFSDAGKLVALFGVSPIADHPDVGVVWMLGTDDIFKRRREFHKAACLWLADANTRFPILTNLIDERNTVHLDWLRRMGFVFLRRIEKWGAESRPFLEFARHQSCALAP